MNLLELNNYLSTNKFVDIKLSSHDKSIIKLIKTSDVLYFTYLPNEIKLIIIDILYPKSIFHNHTFDKETDALRININIRKYDLYAFCINGKYFTVENLNNYDFKALRHSSRSNKPLGKLTFGTNINDSIYLYKSNNRLNLSILNNIGISNILCFSLEFLNNTIISYKKYHKK